jgi:capsular polysaccharide biosynthesis protein
MSALLRRSPWLIVATLTAAGAAAGAGYGLTAPKEYRATAELLVSPVPAADSTYTGIDVLRDTGGKRTAAASAAALLRGPLVADAVRAQLGLHRSRNALLSALDAHVVGSSDVVAVTITDGSPVGAAQIANAFVDTLVNQRTASFDRDVVAAITRDDQALASLPARSPAARHLRSELDRLHRLAGAPDPSLRQAGQAVPPTAASWPDAGELAALGAAIGLGVGLLAALVHAFLRGSLRRSRPVHARPVSERTLEELVDRLDSRFTARAAALATRERDLQRAIEDVKSAHGAMPLELDDVALRRRELDERVAAVTKRELEVARRSARLALPAVEPLAELGPGPVPVPELEPDPEPEPEPAPVPPEPEPAPVPPEPAPVPPEQSPEPLPAGPAVGARGAYNLLALERLVEERRNGNPERAEEWATYLFFLRDYAAPDGSVPGSFDWLIEDTFGELLG